jgi:membrane protein DedA with SNARE-associated domain
MPDLTVLTPIIENYDYLAIFFAMLLEGACIVIPSELVLGFAGFLVYQGKLTFISSAAAAWLGSLTGSLCIYCLAKYAGRNFLYRWGHVIHLTPERLDTTAIWFNHYGPAMLIPLRILPVIRPKTSIIAGLLDMNPAIFLGYTALGIGIWCAIGITIGQYLGSEWQVLLAMFYHFGRLLMIAASLLISCLALLWYFKLRKAKEAS